MIHLPLTAKKSLRTLGLFMAMLSAVTTLSSCDPDDDLYYSIEGYWQQIAPSVDGYVSYSFYNDGTGEYYVNDYYGEEFNDFIWWTNGMTLTVDYGYDIYYYTWQTQGDNLYLTPDDGSAPLVFRYIY